jgi:hypothetical protein
MSSDAVDVITQLVWSGFYEEAEILEIVTEEVFEQGEIDEEWALARIRDETTQKALDEASWPDVTDCDRLDDAFAMLNQSGIIAIQNAGYTQSDGIDEISEIYRELGGESSSVEGYCFYHGQDLERAVDGNGLMLTFGDILGTDEKGAEIGMRIVTILQRCGLDVQWPGSIDTRIEIPDICWQRRTLTTAEEALR